MLPSDSQPGLSHSRRLRCPQNAVDVPSSKAGLLCLPPRMPSQCTQTENVNSLNTWSHHRPQLRWPFYDLNAQLWVCSAIAAFFPPPLLVLSRTWLALVICGLMNESNAVALASISVSVHCCSHYFVKVSCFSRDHFHVLHGTIALLHKSFALLFFPLNYDIILWKFLGLHDFLIIFF